MSKKVFSMFLIMVLTIFKDIVYGGLGQKGALFDSGGIL